MSMVCAVIQYVRTTEILHVYARTIPIITFQPFRVFHKYELFSHVDCYRGNGVAERLNVKAYSCLRAPPCNPISVRKERPTLNCCANIVPRGLLDRRHRSRRYQIPSGLYCCCGCCIDTALLT